MPEYRISYDTTISVSLTLNLAGDDEALSEEESQDVVEEYLNATIPGFGEWDIAAAATVDGMAPARIERRDGDSWVRIGGES